VRELTIRHSALAAQELRAGVPTVPATPDPSGTPAMDVKPFSGDLASLPGAPVRTAASRRGRRRSATLVRRG
jgi:hypothetical protein